MIPPMSGSPETPAPAGSPAGALLEGWGGAAVPRRRTLEGARVRVEPLSAERHGPALWDALGEDVPGWTYRLSGPRGCDEFLDWCAALECEGSIVNAAYVERATGRPFGMGSLMSVQPAAGSIEIGAIQIAPHAKGTPLSTEAIWLQMAQAFALGYRRLEWTCDPLNAASMRAAERLGFTYEAHFRQAYATKGRNRDKAVFAITNGDWPAIDGAIRRWLDPANFATDGMQATRLSDLTRSLVEARAPALSPAPPAAPRTNEHDQPIGPPLPAGWRPPPHPARGTMVGRHARLEPLTVDHAPALHAANLEDGRIWDWLPYGPYASEADYCAWVASATLDRDPLFYAVVTEEGPVGVASYLRIEPAHGVIEVGHINFSARLQRTIAATETMVLMMAWAFEAGYRRYEWKCNALNGPSRRAAERLGLSYEGTFRQATVSKGRNRDTAWFAATDGDWPTIRAAFDRWLAPGNFDTDGRQRESLSVLTRPLLHRQG